MKDASGSLLLRLRPPRLPSSPESYNDAGGPEGNSYVVISVNFVIFLDVIVEVISSVSSKGVWQGVSMDSLKYR
jgi:hypothetical protein